MSLAAAFLEKLAEWRPGAGRQTLTVADDDGHARADLTVDHREALSCLVWELSVRRDAPAADGLAGWAGRIARRASGLLESLKVIEVDAVRDEAVLRSSEPQRGGAEVAYHEVFLKGSREAVLRRYRAAAGVGRREQVAFAATNEALAKFLDDLSAASQR